MNTTKLSSIFLTLVFSGICLAQSESSKPAPSEPDKYYRLDFVVKELEGGKVLNSRAYSMMLPVDEARSEPHSIRTGSRVPIATRSGTADNITYIDVGVNIDCTYIRRLQDRLALRVTADVSTIANDVGHADLIPVIRQTRWSSKVVVPIRKATTIFLSDDATSKRQMQLELTATPVQ